jgi:hypothetical protein
MHYRITFDAQYGSGGWNGGRCLLWLFNGRWLLMRGPLGTRVQGLPIATGVDTTTTIWASTASNYNYICRFCLTWTNVSAPGAGGSNIKIYEGDVTNSNSTWIFVPSSTFGTAVFTLGDEGMRSSAAGSHFSIAINSGGTVTAIFTGYQSTST